jgi:hypothetical protein
MTAATTFGVGDWVKFYAGIGEVIGLHRKGKNLLVKAAHRDKPFWVKAKEAKLAVDHTTGPLAALHAAVARGVAEHGAVVAVTA